MVVPRQNDAAGQQERRDGDSKEGFRHDSILPISRPVPGNPNPMRTARGPMPPHPAMTDACDLPMAALPDIASVFPAPMSVIPHIAGPRRGSSFIAHGRRRVGREQHDIGSRRRGNDRHASRGSQRESNGKRTNRYFHNDLFFNESHLSGWHSYNARDPGCVDNTRITGTLKVQPIILRTADSRGRVGPATDQG